MADVSKILNVVAESLKLTNEHLPKVLNQIECLISYSNQLLKTADLNSSSNSFVRKLMETINLAELFICKVDDINGYISGSWFKDEGDKVKDLGADHGLVEFNASLIFIDEQVNECSRLYKEYEKKSLETEKECIFVKAICQERAREAKNAKNLTRGIMYIYIIRILCILLF